MTSVSCIGAVRIFGVGTLCCEQRLAEVQIAFFS